MLTLQEAFALVGTIRLYDPRQGPPDDRVELGKWMKASEVAGWPSYAAAEEAVHLHYATVTYPIMPGHITQILAEQREQRRVDARFPARFELPAGGGPQPEASPARAKALAEIVATLAQRRSIPPAE